MSTVLWLLPLNADNASADSVLAIVGAPLSVYEEIFGIKDVEYVANEFSSSVALEPYDHTGRALCHVPASVLKPIVAKGGEICAPAASYLKELYDKRVALYWASGVPAWTHVIPKTCIEQDYVRCPKCGHTENPLEDGEGDLFDEGTWNFTCSSCNFNYPVTVNVTRSFDSPARQPKAEELIAKWKAKGAKSIGVSKETGKCWAVPHPHGYECETYAYLDPDSPEAITALIADQARMKEEVDA